MLGPAGCPACLLPPTWPVSRCLSTPHICCGLARPCRFCLALLRPCNALALFWTCIKHACTGSMNQHIASCHCTKRMLSGRARRSDNTDTPQPARGPLERHGTMAAIAAPSPHTRAATPHTDPQLAHQAGTARTRQGGAIVLSSARHISTCAARGPTDRKSAVEGTRTARRRSAQRWRR